MKQIQTDLKRQGFKPGPIDGLIGPKTRKAIADFAAANRSAVELWRAIEASEGRPSLEPPRAITDNIGTPPWMAEAKRIKGKHEVRDLTFLQRWLRSDGKTLGDPSKLPWCGDFVETCIRLALPNEKVPDNPYLAINWLKFGVEVEPQVGAVLVFWRGSPEDWRGHVGFYAGEDATHYHVLGGNQSNAVTIAKIAKKRLRDGGVRWPVTGPQALGDRRFRSGSGYTITTNEE